MQKKAIIFDLDGTLINSLPDIAASMNRALKASGLATFETQDYRMKVGNGVFNLAKRSVGDRTDCLDAVLSAYMKDYAENCAIDTFVYPGVADMLDGLNARGLKVCVFSNKDQADVEKVLARYFPGFPFAAIRGRVENVPLKPDPAGALLMAEALNTAPGECWYSGDTLMDMRCGNGAGMTTIGVTWGFRPRSDLVENHARFIVDTPEELLKIVDQEA